MSRRSATLKTAMKADDKEAIERKAEALGRLAAALLQQASATRPAPAPGGAGTGAAASVAKHGDDVVDADSRKCADKDRKP